MSPSAVTVDVGSTFTKVLGVADDGGTVVLARPRTRIGEPAWLDGVREAVGDTSAERVFVTSSAGGGLRVVAVGLTQMLTAEAARLAAAGAGARIVAARAGALTPEDAEHLGALRPDVVLLAGGVDGGDREAVVASAAALAARGAACPVVLAGNRQAAPEAARILAGAGLEAIAVPNLMPSFGTLDLEPSRAAIRGLFQARIVAGKGVAPVAALSAHPVQPTPAALLAAATVLARRTASVMVVDAGGATVDVHSVVEQQPLPGEQQVGLPVPAASRTVEGDLGLKWNAAAVLADGDRDRRAAERIEDDADALPDGDLGERLLDRAVAAAVRRHCGRPVRVLSPEVELAFEGKDCRRVELLVGTGGPFRVHPEAGESALRAALAQPGGLVPEHPTVVVDRGYAFGAAGALAGADPDLAQRVLEGAIVTRGARV